MLKLYRLGSQADSIRPQLFDLTKTYLYKTYIPRVLAVSSSYKCARHLYGEGTNFLSSYAFFTQEYRLRLPFI